VLRPRIPLPRAPRLPIAACAVVVDVLREHSIGVAIKWPNDVLFDGQGVRRIRRADLDAAGPDDYAVLGDTVTGAGFQAGGSGQPRGFAGGRVFELTNEPGCTGDVDGDGEVGSADLGALLSAWGSNGAADFDGSDVVDSTDLGILLTNWGTCGQAN